MKRRPTWHTAYDAQMGLWRWTRSEWGKRWQAIHFRDNSSELMESTQRLLAALYSAEDTKLLEASPTFVSAEMVDVIEAASDSFQPEPLLATDMMCATGFVYLERGIVIPNRFDKPVSLKAFSWTPTVTFREGTADAMGELVDGAVGVPDDRKQAVAIQYKALNETMADGEDVIDIVRELEGVPMTTDKLEGQAQWFYDSSETAYTGVALTVYTDDVADIELDPRLGTGWNTGFMGPPPELVPLHLTPWWLGMSYDGNEWDENGKPTGAEWWWKVVQATFRLMQQKIAVRHQERPDRPSRRDAARQGFHEQDVVVVRLRRERDDTMPDNGPHSEANYSHRFIVSGHWRNQWYPASHVHRQIWISPYVKGPEDQPLVVRPRRVFTLTR